MEPDHPSFDPIWEDLYNKGKHLNRYPYTTVVSVISSLVQSMDKKNEIRVLEVGCGAGNNLWFAAREGLQVSGIDASSAAINYAKNRFREEDLEGDFRIGDFTDLPFDDHFFDLVIDRAAITSTGLSNSLKAIKEVNRVLKKGSRFYSELFSDSTTVGLGSKVGDNLIMGIDGPYSGVGQICLYSRSQLLNNFSENWKILDLWHVQNTSAFGKEKKICAQWNILAEKT